ncbi:MAG: sterol desaturase family protein [Bacteroidota bacterium]
MENTYHPIPEHLQPRKEKTSELFKNGWLEKLTRTSLIVPVIMHISIATAFLYYAVAVLQLDIRAVIVLFFAGGLMWTFTEYWVHRSGYHCQTKAKWLLKIQHLGHGIHHQYPKDAERLAMPPIPALLLISLIFGLFWLVGGTWAVPFFSGFLIGYMLYIVLHYAQHRYKAPDILWLKKLWKHHALHHYKHPETKAFGVSTRIWDYIFGTMP